MTDSTAHAFLTALAWGIVLETFGANLQEACGAGVVIHGYISVLLGDPYPQLMYGMGRVLQSGCCPEWGYNAKLTVGVWFKNSTVATAGFEKISSTYIGGLKHLKYLCQGFTDSAVATAEFETLEVPMSEVQKLCSSYARVGKIYVGNSRTPVHSHLAIHKNGQFSKLLIGGMRTCDLT
ncbi:hypothetical protein BKA83DRAFT_4130597 [Pisolithus microcarpus]|nr:hypothetical protein BKA83DRAFT_4130597 [Pisolithus microcarpus]